MRRLLFVVALAALFGAAPARAQVSPPPQTAPVFEVVAPTVSPVCGNALLVAALAPGIVAGQTGGAVPLNGVTPALGPLYTVCGSVPAPPARLTCSADHTLNDAANMIAAGVAGAPLPVGVAPFGALAEQVVVLQDKLPPPANSAGLAGKVVATLDCKAVTAPSSPPPSSPDSGTETPAGAPTDDSLLTNDFALAPALGGALAPDITAPAAPRSGQALPLAPAGASGNPGFAYPIVFAFPLVLLVIGGYLGRALTRPVAPPHH